MKLCTFCDEEIHPMRLEALPTTTTCVKCSQEGKIAAKLSHKVDREDVETTLEFYSAEQFKKIVEIEKRYSSEKE
jgi:hypothetical protein